MNTEERDLISGLFARMGEMRGIEKDLDAATLIRREAAANPDAVYLLTQSVLVQEQALQAANARIQELEASIGSQSSATVSGVTGARRSEGFGRPAAGSVPSAGGRSAGFGSSAASSGARASVPPTGSSVPPTGNRGAPGGFMAQAMTTAVGVAGGMLLASGISSLMGGSSATAAPASGDAAAQPAEPAAANEAEPAADETAAADDGAFQDADAGADGDGWFGGDWGDFGGGDFDA